MKLLNKFTDAVSNASPTTIHLGALLVPTVITTAMTGDFKAGALTGITSAFFCSLMKIKVSDSSAAEDNNQNLDNQVDLTPKKKI